VKLDPNFINYSVIASISDQLHAVTPPVSSNASNPSHCTLTAVTSAYGWVLPGFKITGSAHH
jgi:hypothetical protein